MKTFSKLQCYLGRRKPLLPLALVLSAISELSGMLPYLLIWLIVKELINDGGFTGDSPVIVYSCYAAGFAVAGVLLYYAALMCSHLAAFRVESNIRREAMRKVLSMPLGFFDMNTIGKIRKIIDDNASVTHSFLAHQLPDLAGTVLVPIVALVMIVVFDWRLGIACLVPVGIAIAIMAHTMNTKGREFMKAYMTLLEQMNTEAVEYVRGIPVVKVFQQTVYSFKSFYRVIMEYNHTATKYTRLWERPMTFYSVIINSFAFFLVPLAIILSGDDSAASVILNLILFVLITPVFSQCVMKSMYIGQAIGQADEAINRLDALTAYRPLSTSKDIRHIDAYDISFENVSFAYPGTSARVLSGMSFTIRQGSRIALVGASGSGKTTIARLVPRFYDVDEGCVRIGGVDVRDVKTDELMRSVSFVFQNPRLFKTTIRENITYGKPNASHEDIERAIEMAQCRDIIDRLPNGLDTRIGTEGTYLSGGEQQRIVLVRAILKDAPIIVLDEATAFADPENEHLVQQALRELTRGKTVLMIAHRLTSITDVDNIIVVDNGNIAEQGTHKELLEMKGIYYNRWNEYCQSVNWTIGKEANND
ncbi:MAG: ABC transporter ATP-binding protein [Prevotellaceae bacterium]|nr:ABC transporter ATP-binding protein [Prevotellaceae bacterium]